MIKLTRLDGSEFHLNPDLIETVEETPDTHITLTNGDRFLVREKAPAIVEKIVLFKTTILRRGGISRKEKYLQRRLVQGYRTPTGGDDGGES